MKRMENVQSGNYMPEENDVQDGNRIGKKNRIQDGNAIKEKDRFQDGNAIEEKNRFQKVEQTPERKAAERLLEFIRKSPTAFHAAAEAAAQLEKRGYEKLSERQSWELRPEGKYYVTRNDSSLIAFRMPENRVRGCQVMACHSDSPALKLKNQPELVVEQRYVKLNVEKYGGMLCAPWFDRPLSVAGRVIVREFRPGREDRTAPRGFRLTGRLVNVDRDLLMIPSLAIHMNRQVNEGYAYNAQKDLLPLLTCQENAEKGALMNLIAAEANVAPKDILGTDLFLYSRSPGCIWGLREEFVSCGRLDDLQCAFAGLMGFLGEDDRDMSAGREISDIVPVFCMLDNEEVGSTTKQGAASTFLKDVLKRICAAAGGKQEDYLRMLANSFMVSADNAHGVHPNYADKADPSNRPYLNGGIVIKHSANQKYTTDAVSEAVWRQVCDQAGVPVQSFFNRSDMAGGSTLGNIANTQTPMNTVDIGLPQLAMHSPYETAGVKDTLYLIRAMKEFYSCCVAGWL